MSLIRKTIAALAFATTLAAPAFALEYPIGTPQQKHGMEIAAVYLQPVEMELNRFNCRFLIIIINVPLHRSRR